jgi:hypothetical protein
VLIVKKKKNTKAVLYINLICNEQWQYITIILRSQNVTTHGR